MKHSNFKRFLCLVLAFCLILPYCVIDIRAAEETVTTIKHTKTTGDINYFTFSETGWSATNSTSDTSKHVWSDDPDNVSPIWYSVKFVGNKIDVYAGGNHPMGYVEYFIDGKSMGEYSLYLPSNQTSRKVVTFDGLAEGLHEFKAVATGKNGAGGNNLIDCAEVVVYSTPVEPVTTEIPHTQQTGDSLCADAVAGPGGHSCPAEAEGRSGHSGGRPYLAQFQGRNPHHGRSDVHDCGSCVCCGIWLYGYAVG